MMLHFHLTDKGMEIDDQLIQNWNDIKIESFLRYFESPYRLVHLEHDITLYIFDQIGIRFWVEKNRIYQAQVLLDPSQKNIFPKEPYTGKLSVQDKEVPLPLTTNSLKENKDIQLELDTDSLHYKVYLYKGFIGEKKYVFKADELNHHIIGIEF